MSVELQIANYLRLAADDIDGADVLRKSDNRNDAYLAEQAAEKLLMALLTSEGIKPDRKDNHRLDVLCFVICCPKRTHSRSVFALSPF